MRVQWILAIMVPLAASQGCGDSGTTNANGGGCTKDTDCKGDRICVARQCVSASAADSGADGPSGSSGSSSSGGGSSAGTGGRSTGGQTAGGGAGGSDAGVVGGADSGGPGGAGGGADAAPPGPECTQRDTSACPPSFPFPACCTRAGTCGSLIGALGCTANRPTPDAGTGAGGATGGGGLVSTACKTCRSTSCATQLAACNANTACKTLSSCIDNATPFTLLNCGITTVTQPVRTLYDALSSCASTSCAASNCPNINL